MPSKAKNNGAAPLAQPPVRTLAVPEYLRPRIEAAHKRIEEENPGAMSHQAVLNVLIVCGLEAIEFQYLTHGTGSTATALQTMAAHWAKRGDQKTALEFVQWSISEPSPTQTVDHKLAKAIKMFAPDDLEFLTVETAKPGVIERVYDDSVQEPLTASEQGRD